MNEMKVKRIVRKWERMEKGLQQGATIEHPWRTLLRMGRCPRRQGTCGEMKGKVDGNGLWEMDENILENGWNIAGQWMDNTGVNGKRMENE